MSSMAISSDLPALGRPSKATCAKEEDKIHNSVEFVSKRA